MGAKNMSNSENGKEKRKSPRFEIPVKLRPTELFGKEGRVQNISIGGVSIFGIQSVEVGRKHTINFALPNDEWVSAEVLIVWAIERPSESILKYDIGCQFTDVSPESQIILEEYLAKITPK